jgi:hypothetical protein
MLAAAAVVMTISAASSIAHAETQAPDIDMDAVHKAFWEMKGSSSTSALQWFEQEANRYYSGEGQVSIDARRTMNAGRLYTVVTGYVDQDGVAGLNPASDRVLFRFAQTGPMVGNQIPYEYLDSYGNVYYRGTRFLPSYAFYSSYYLGGASLAYYTPSWRIGFLRPWLASYRVSPAYIGWRSRFYANRAGYVGRIHTLRTRYGASVVAPRLSLSFRSRPAIRTMGTRPVIRATVRTSVSRPLVRASVRTSVSRPMVRATVRTSVSRPAVRTTVTRTTTVRSAPRQVASHRPSSHGRR